MTSQIAVIGPSSPSGRVILFGNVYSAITDRRPSRRIQHALAADLRGPHDHAGGKLPVKPRRH